jgi:hypothetical protein
MPDRVLDGQGRRRETEEMYILQRIPPMPKRELDRYVLFAPRPSPRSAPVEGRCSQSRRRPTTRHSCASSAGWLRLFARWWATRLFMLRPEPDLGDIPQEYVQWLQTTQRYKYFTTANYLNGLVSITSYCYANLERRESHSWPWNPTHGHSSPTCVARRRRSARLNRCTRSA